MPLLTASGGSPTRRFNEAAGADPADASPVSSLNDGVTGCFNEAAGADPADAAFISPWKKSIR